MSPEQLYFQPQEFLCRCGEATCPAPREVTRPFLMTLNLMRHYFARPLIVTSGLRCPTWNAKVGGRPNSEHLTGEGADLICLSAAFRWEMMEAARHAGFTRLGIGKDFLHVGLRDDLGEKVVWAYY